MSENAINYDVEVYRLMNLVGAYDVLHRRMTRPGSRSSAYSWVIGNYFDPTLRALLLQLAAAFRVAMDVIGDGSHEGPHGEKRVGTLVEDVRKDSAPVALTFRQACNKILHADRSAADLLDPTWENHKPVAGGWRDPECPSVVLECSYRGKDWRATLDLWAFCEVGNAVQ